MTWFHGPPWLNDKTQWPTQFNEIDTSKNEEILEVNAMILACATEEAVFDISRYSSLNKVIRVFACVRKAIKNFKTSIGRNGRSEECDQSLEFHDAKKELIKMEQSRYFSNEINCLKQKSPLLKTVVCETWY